MKAEDGRRMSELGREVRDGLEGMLARLARGEARALARAISVVEDGGEGARELLAGCAGIRAGLGGGAGRRARRIGVTGPPGAGKSTLVDHMVRWLRRQGESVGVIAVDPTSPYTGGALLGDRIRMNGFAGDEGVSIRSMASRGAMGGLAKGVAAVCEVMEAAGRGTVIVETVGVGQDEVEIAGLADVTVLVLVPGMGDDVQSLKAGVMEIADIFVVNKSELPGADAVEQEILAMQGLAGAHGAWVPPVVRTVAQSGSGVGELMEAIGRFASERGARPAEQDTGIRLDRLVVDHFGIAVRSLEAARGFYELLGLRVGAVETVAGEQVRVAMLAVGESRIELLEATAEDSVIGRFVAKRGEGMHHVALRAEGPGGLNGQFARLREAGVRLIGDGVKVGAGGHRYFFVHPESTGGVLLEVVGD